MSLKVCYEQLSCYKNPNCNQKFLLKQLHYETLMNYIKQIVPVKEYRLTHAEIENKVIN